MFKPHYCLLIFILVEKEILLSGIVRPDILDTFIDITLILYLLQVLKHLQRSTLIFNLPAKVHIIFLFANILPNYFTLSCVKIYYFS